MGQSRLCRHGLRAGHGGFRNGRQFYLCRSHHLGFRCRNGGGGIRLVGGIEHQEHIQHLTQGGQGSQTQRDLDHGDDIFHILQQPLQGIGQ